MADAYLEFLRKKVQLSEAWGFHVDAAEINPLCMQHQVVTIQWALAGGRRGIFKKFGLGKTIDQLEIARLARRHAGGKALIVVDLGVRQEFVQDAMLLATGDSPSITDAQRAQLQAWQEGRPDRIPRVKFIRSVEECEDEETIYLANYETVRDGKLDPRHFTVVCLDEADCLRGFGGTKTFREFMALFAGDDRRKMHERIRGGAIPYRFVATATPSPNDYIELLAYSAFLGIMDVGQAKTRFFKRNSEKADQLTIHPHKEREFWLWVASWALFVQRPSDLDPSFSDEGFELPELDVRWHEIPSDHAEAGHEMSGQALMFKKAAIGVIDAAREKRASLDARVAKLMEIRAEDPGAHRILWHDLEDERRALERAIPSVHSVYGSQELDEREQLVLGFRNGQYQELASKPVLLGAGCNFQHHCHWAIFLGIGHKFKDFIQAVHRLQRYMQRSKVRLDLIYTEAERPVRQNLERKWAQDIEQRQKMASIVKEFGLSRIAMAQVLTRAIGVQRVETRGERYVIANNDCVDETRRMESDSVGLILSSIPFSSQYEYSPNYADFGHSDSNGHFWEQMEYLIPELMRVLAPGRLCAIHVKDRIVPKGMTGRGYQTVYPFHADAIEAFTTCPECRVRLATNRNSPACTHRFGYMGMKTIVTDVVRENNQTYRLGWTEQCKDGTKMGVGMPEYLLIFRKDPSDTSDGYADKPVEKLKPFSLDEDGNMIPFQRGAQMAKGTGYSRARWQLDAHGFTRSSGNRLLTPEELVALPADVIFKLYREHSLSTIYDFEHHVRCGEELEAAGKLPPGFMLLQPQSWSEEVWSDITRMLTLNGSQAAKGKEMHLCPMQFDLADRAIVQWSMPGEEVYDPFGGLMTVPYRAIKLGRRGRASELNPAYFIDGAGYCKAAEMEAATPTLFDLDELEAA